MVAPHLPSFRGRTSECQALDRLLENVRGGQSAVLVIRGQVGVGKTALLRYAARRASGFRVAQIAGVEAEMELPFAGLHQLCSGMLGQLDALPKPQQDALRIALGLSSGDAPDRFLVAAAALSLLSEVADERPLVCFVDDAQWLDGASGQVLGFVARRLLAEQVAMVFGLRDPSRECNLEGLPELALGGLEEPEARALLATVVPGRIDEGVRDRIIAETRGNPLALLELSRGMSAAAPAGGFGIPKAGDLPDRIEEHYLGQVGALPETTQRLMLLAAAEPVGDASLLWRAAQALGIGRAAAEPAEAEQLLEIGARVRFRHPLVRSAVYRVASAGDRRAVHGALAAATDAELDPDRRAWHRAHAAQDPDEDVACELLQCASEAERRGGIAASAAFLERAMTLTPDPGQRALRALAAAWAKFEAGDFPAAESLLATAGGGPLDELGQARVERMRAQIAFDLRRGSDAPPLLLRAAQRLERLDPELARETYLEALVAAIYAGRLAPDTDSVDIALAARSVSLDPEPSTARQLLLLGLATRLTGSYAMAVPTLAGALRAHLAEERQLDWLSVAYNLAAMELWDDQAWFELASSQADHARSTGVLVLLPYALDYLAGFHIQAGELAAAAGILSEAEGLDLGIRAETLPYTPLRLAAWRGQTSIALDLVEVMMRGALARGEGCAITATEYSTALLYNGIGQYELALESARNAAAPDEIVTSSWALYELVEAASRCGQREVAREAADRLSERASASGTEWARGVVARSYALVEDGEAAEKLYRQAIEWLGHSRMTAHLARAQLIYGEWLRRENRRVDARQQLREAHEMLASMGASGFADRARRELLATGEKVRKRRDDTRDELTPQELNIARLARDGRTNPEIGAELFISARTVEWHLRKVFTKLGISSRRGLREALPSRERKGAPR
ncbi:MAG TPA: AAA family ATPase [Acidimicrobiales bacterium]|jgi:DNA-binding CsgD family transcriptional regulator|nr:AAA family ATPase [Acidimicrobiales bacterium]